MKITETQKPRIFEPFSFNVEVLYESDLKTLYLHILQVRKNTGRGTRNELFDYIMDKAKEVGIS